MYWARGRLGGEAEVTENSGKVAYRRERAEKGGGILGGYSVGW